jgi:uncharacterized protein DUF6152
MKNKGLALVSVISIYVFLISPAVFAHHSAASFDTEHMVTVKGTVTGFEWTNPHIFIYLDVKDDKGNVDSLRVEANSPNMLTRVGWNREMIKPGDQIAVTGSYAKNGKKIMRLHTLTLASGQEFDGEGFKQQ